MYFEADLVWGMVGKVMGIKTTPLIEGRCLVNGRMVLTIGYGNVFYDMFAPINETECTCHRARSLRRHFR